MIGDCRKTCKRNPFHSVQTFQTRQSNLLTGAGALECSPFNAIRVLLLILYCRIARWMQRQVQSALRIANCPPSNVHRPSVSTKCAHKVSSFGWPQNVFWLMVVSSSSASAVGDDARGRSGRAIAEPFDMFFCYFLLPCSLCSLSLFLVTACRLLKIGITLFITLSLRAEGEWDWKDFGNVFQLAKALTRQFDVAVRLSVYDASSVNSSVYSQSIIFSVPFD